MRRVSAGALAGAAALLGLGARVAEDAAKALRVSHDDRRPAAPSPSASPVAKTEQPPRRPRTAADAPPPDLRIDDDPVVVRTFESHTAELAAKPVAQVVAAVATLSTDELRMLTEYEQAHRNRRGVLAAIERAAIPRVHTPTPEEDAALLDPRPTDELVYTSETPPG